MRRRGFSLIELVVAVGITAVLAAVLLVIVSNTVTWWGRSAGALMLDSEANLVLERLTADLQSAFARRDGHTWMQAPDEEGDAWVLRFFGNLATTSGATDDPTTLREVTYQRDGTKLYRFEGTAAEALTTNYAWQSWPAGEGAAEFLLATQIDSIAVEFFLSPDAPTNSPSAEAWPRLARVELVLISEDGLRRLEAIELHGSGESSAAVRNETTRRYVQWVDIIGRVL